MRPGADPGFWNRAKVERRMRQYRGAAGGGGVLKIFKNFLAQNSAFWRLF